MNLNEPSKTDEQHVEYAYIICMQQVGALKTIKEKVEYLERKIQVCMFGGTLGRQIGIHLSSAGKSLLSTRLGDERRLLEKNEFDSYWATLNDLPSKEQICLLKKKIGEIEFELGKQGVLRERSRSDSFLDWLDRKLKQLEHLEALDNPPIRQGAVARDADHTTSRQVIAIYYLLMHAGLDVRKDRKIKPTAEFINFLTGKNIDSIKEQIPPSRTRLDPRKIDDKEFVAKKLRSLNLGEIISLMEDDFGSESE